MFWLLFFLGVPYGITFTGYVPFRIFMYHQELIFGYYLSSPVAKELCRLFYYLNLHWSSFSTHDCLAGKCEAQQGPIMCPG
jgi:hypothetical protein